MHKKLMLRRSGFLIGPGSARVPRAVSGGPPGAVRQKGLGGTPKPARGTRALPGPAVSRPISYYLVFTPHAWPAALLVEQEFKFKQFPGHRWVSLDGVRDGRAAGLAIINDAKYGYSTPGPDLRVSIVRGAPYALHRKPEPGVDYLWMDQGAQTFRMLLIPHDGDWSDAGLTRAADEFTAPVPAILQGMHPGARPQSDSFLSVDADNITIAAIKLAEDDDDLILRCHETDGRPAAAAVRLHFAGKNWSGRFRPHEIKTLRFNRSTGAFREVNLLEE
jgi:alpha-mannosidase